MRTRVISLTTLLFLFGYDLLVSTAAAESAGGLPRTISFEASLQEILIEHDVATASAAVIEGGDVVWTGYFGEQSPGVPASKDTLFNVASVTKTIAAELIVQLVEAGEISLDESMSRYWIDPDLADDPRHVKLTPRFALTHRTGFPNWRYTDPDFRLRFQSEPGKEFGYSGEGFEYVARFAEKKLGKSFDALVEEYVFVPNEMRDTSMSPAEWVMPRIALPVDEAGDRKKPFCSGPDGGYCADIGEWSAADEMVTTVEDYARFLISVMGGSGLSRRLVADRLTVQTSTANDAVLSCPLPADECPTEQGYGLGWEIFDFGDEKIVSHGGSDWSERAMIYFNANSGDGIIVFLNAPSSSSVEALIDVTDYLDNGSPIARMYRGWVDAYNAAQESKHQ